MRFSLTVFSALFVTAWGSMLLGRQTSLPDCALPCITNVDYGSCSPSDNACLCKSETYVNTTTTCIESSCTGSDLTTAIATAQALCAEVGVTFSSTSLPTGSATRSGSGSSGSVAASTTASRSAEASSTSAASSQTGGALGLNSAQALVGIAGAGVLALLF
ncbi:uncharacterized protein EV420DRAFT_1574977 [Desarmillaria tabescens]|uniref:CFEM domain-containing protein n=1 Tax=Armillaria tabescens TaxID=1929756 RepID=A0AA39JPM4_ARMTA|nr:uncharacterized protein EV420DRAFT_1574977 [Desarmillaria tabescens]KAK0444253.1 hypothetical protein EV420DRAFT_1574977 [Desarmillaria tabescens]